MGVEWSGLFFLCLKALGEEDKFALVSTKSFKYPLRNSLDPKEGVPKNT